MSGQTWKLVPVEPTGSQIMAAARAAKQYFDECGGNSPTVIYQAMLDAAPQPPAPAPVMWRGDATRDEDIGSEDEVVICLTESEADRYRDERGYVITPLYAATPDIEQLREEVKQLRAECLRIAGLERAPMHNPAAMRVWKACQTCPNKPVTSGGKESQ